MQERTDPGRDVVWSPEAEKIIMTPRMFGVQPLNDLRQINYPNRILPEDKGTFFILSVRNYRK